MIGPHEIDDKRRSNRIRFPKDEAEFPWLPLLLDAYAIIDEGVSIAIKQEEDKRSTNLSCKEGCCNCCHTHKDIPVYPLEIVGIYWFTIEKTRNPLRAGLKKQLSIHSKSSPCPFLTEHSCSIYPVRPVSCRQFNVFNRPCSKGEDPYYTRREDVLIPVRDYTDRAFFVMLPFYGVTKESDKIQTVKNNLIHTQVRNLHSCDWKALAKRMDDFDLKNLHSKA